MDLSKLDLRPYVDYRVENIMPIKKKYGFRVTVIYEDLSEKECQHSGYEKKAEADRARDAVIAQLHEGTYVVYKDIKLYELLEYWLENVMKVKPDFRANSYTTYKNCIYNHIIPQIGNLKLVTLNQGHILKFLKGLAVKYPSMPRIAKPVLNTSLEYAVSKKLMVLNPCAEIKLPAEKEKAGYHTLVIKESKTLTLEQVKTLLVASKESKIHMQLVFALLMGLRRGEINGLKYSDVDFEKHTLRIERQLGEDLHADKEKLPVHTITKQEVPPKTQSSYREIPIPDYVYHEILEERKIYEKNRSRRQHGKWIFQDLDYICCSSYGRPRSKHYHFVHYKKLLKELGLPDIRFHDLRGTYATLLMKNSVNQKAVAEVMGHANSIITVDVYTDKKAIIEGWLEGMQPFIDEVHPYDEQDVGLLKKMFGMDISLKTASGRSEETK